MWRKITLDYRAKKVQKKNFFKYFFTQIQKYVQKDHKEVQKGTKNLK